MRRQRARVLFLHSNNLMNFNRVRGNARSHAIIAIRARPSKVSLFFTSRLLDLVDRICMLDVLVAGFARNIGEWME